MRLIRKHAALAASLAMTFIGYGLLALFTITFSMSLALNKANAALISLCVCIFLADCLGWFNSDERGN
jgi:hypothetical protein